MHRVRFLVLLGGLAHAAWVGGPARLAAAADANRSPGETLPRVFLLDATTLVETRRRVAAGDRELAAAVARLRDEADRALAVGPFSVTAKKALPPSGDKHDYMSLGPYWWPDPGKPDGKPTSAATAR